MACGWPGDGNALSASHIALGIGVTSVNRRKEEQANPRSRALCAREPGPCRDRPPILFFVIPDEPAQPVRSGILAWLRASGEPTYCFRQRRCCNVVSSSAPSKIPALGGHVASSSGMTDTGGTWCVVRSAWFVVGRSLKEEEPDVAGAAGSPPAFFRNLKNTKSQRFHVPLCHPHPTPYAPRPLSVIPDEARSAEIGDLAVCLQPCPRHSGKAAASGRAARVLSFYFRTPSHRHLRRTGAVGEIGNLVVADHPPPLSSSPTRRGAPRSGILAMPGTPNEPARSSPFRLRANGAALGPIRFRLSRAARPARPE